MARQLMTVNPELTVSHIMERRGSCLRANVNRPFKANTGFTTSAYLPQGF